MQYSVRDFISWAATELGLVLRFDGKGAEEKAFVAAITGDNAPALKVGDCVVAVDPRYFRPTEVDTLLGDASKAHSKLGWRAEISFAELVKEMVATDREHARRDALVAREGFKTYTHHE